MFGTAPKDVPVYIRTLSDVPITMKKEITAILEQSDWKEKKIPEPTLLRQQMNHREV